MKKTFTLTLMFVFSLLTTNCFTQEPGANDVTVNQLNEILKDSSVVLIDVRETDEFQSLPKLARAIHVPLSEFGPAFSRLGIQKEQTFYIICRSGNRSKRLQGHLNKQGYTHAINVLGGMKEWSTIQQ